MDFRMMTDELNINEMILQSSMKIYGRGRSAQSSTHTNSLMSRSSGDSHHTKASSRLIKTIPVFIEIFSSIR
jgi:hypothetical protein